MTITKIILIHYVRILIGVTFFLFGFFVVAMTLEMSLHDIVVGLVAGANGGAVMLIVSVGSSIELNPALRRRFFGQV